MRWRGGLALLGALLSAAAAAQEVPPPLRGPIGPRDEWLLAEPRLTLPAASPDRAERPTLRVRLDWGNDFGWSQRYAGEAPGDRRFLVDGEHRTLDLELARPLGRRADLALRVPLRWRGGGVLDEVIDAWHRLTGLPQNGRPYFLTDAFRVEGRDAEGHPISWPDAGAGLGRIELAARRALGPSSSATRVSIAGRVALPTGTGPFAGGGVGFGAQLLAARRLGGAWEIYLGPGATFETDDEIDGVRYERWRAQGFAAVEWRVGRRWALLGETSAASRLVTNLARYPGLQWYLNLGARLDLDSGWTVEGAFTENLMDQQATTDFGIQVGLARRLR